MKMIDLSRLLCFLQLWRYKLLHAGRARAEDRKSLVRPHLVCLSSPPSSRPCDWVVGRRHVRSVEIESRHRDLLQDNLQTRYTPRELSRRSCAKELTPRLKAVTFRPLKHCVYGLVRVFGSSDLYYICTPILPVSAHDYWHQ